MKIEFRQREDVLDFLREEIKLDLRGQDLEREDRWLFVVARNDHDAVVGCLVLEWTSWFEAHLSLAVVDRRCLAISSLHRLVWQHVFSRTIRVTIMIDPQNTRLEHTVRKLGAVYEGFLRRGLDGDRDALVFGMLREDCRWLRPRPAARQAAKLEEFRAEVMH